MNVDGLRVWSGAAQRTHVTCWLWRPRRTTSKTSTSSADPEKSGLTLTCQVGDVLCMGAMSGGYRLEEVLSLFRCMFWSYVVLHVSQTVVEY